MLRIKLASKMRNREKLTAWQKVRFSLLWVLLVFIVGLSLWAAVGVWRAYTLREKMENADKHTYEQFEQLRAEAQQKGLPFDEELARKEVALRRDPEFKAKYDGTTAIDLWCALVGLVVGVGLTLILHFQSQEQGTRLDDTVTRINHDVQHIVLATIGLRALDDYADVLDAIHGRSGIIATAVDERFNLDIMNPTAWFGYWLTFDIDNLLSDVSILPADEQKPKNSTDSLPEAWERRQNRLRNTTAAHLHQRWNDENRARNHRLNTLEALKSPKVVGGPKPIVRYITLDYEPHKAEDFRSTPDGHDSETALWEGAALIPFIREFAGWGLRDIILCEYAPNEKSLPWTVVGKHDKRKVLLIPSECLEEKRRILCKRPDFVSEFNSGNRKFDETAEAASQRELRCRFAEHLLFKQREDIRRLESDDLKAQVKLLPEIPFQMFVCHSASLDFDPERKSTALLAFSDKFTIGSNNEEIAGFATRSRKAIITMMKTYEQLLKTPDLIA